MAKVGSTPQDTPTKPTCFGQFYDPSAPECQGCNEKTGCVKAMPSAPAAPAAPAKTTPKPPAQPPKGKAAPQPPSKPSAPAPKSPAKKAPAPSNDPKRGEELVAAKEKASWISPVTQEEGKLTKGEKRLLVLLQAEVGSDVELIPRQSKGADRYLRVKAQGFTGVCLLPNKEGIALNKDGKNLGVFIPEDLPKALKKQKSSAKPTPKPTPPPSPAKKAPAPAPHKTKK